MTVATPWLTHLLITAFLQLAQLRACSPLICFSKALKVRVQETPSINPTEVLVEVKAAGLNFFDIYVCQGLSQDITPPCTLGLECAGIVRQVGKEVSTIQEGDHVMVHCPKGGAFSGIVVIDQSNVMTISHNTEFEIAASLTINYLTAYFALVELGGLTNGSSVIIQSAAGGVGWAATQIAKLQPNVTVFGIASKQKHLEIKENGVDYPLTYDQDLKTEVRSICPEGVSIVIDNLAGDSFSKSQEILAPLGKVVFIGAKRMIEGESRNLFTLLRTWWNTKNISPQQLIMENKVAAGLNLNTLKEVSPQKFHEGWKIILQLLNEDKLHPRVDSVFTFEEAGEAFKKITKRQNIGKVILKP